MFAKLNSVLIYFILNQIERAPWWCNIYIVYGNFTHTLELNAIIEEIPKNLGHEKMTIEVLSYHFAFVTSVAVLKIIEYVAFFKNFN